MFKPILVASLLGAAAPSFAQVTTMEASNAAPKEDGNRVVCEREEVTGSRLGARRVCLTALQWEEKRREHREATEKVQRTVNLSPSQ